MLGFHDEQLDCADLFSAVALGVHVKLLRKTARQESSGLRQVIDFLETLRLTDGHAGALHPDTLVLAIDLQTTILRPSILTAPRIPTFRSQQLHDGVIFTSASRRAAGWNYIGLLRHLRERNKNNVIADEDTFFCSGIQYEQERCKSQWLVVDTKRKFAKVPISAYAHVEIFKDILLQYSPQIGQCKKTANIPERARSHRDFNSLKMYHFWINLPRNTERYGKMKSEVRQYSSHMVSKRIKAFGHHDVLKMISSGRLDLPAEWRHTSKTIREIAHTLSHLNAIQAAYDADIPFALITGDDVRFAENLHLNVREVLRVAPKGWQVIQLLTVNLNVRRRFSVFYATDFIKWYPSHWSTSAYIISREGMGVVLDSWHAERVRTHFLGMLSNFTVPADVYLADEYLYTRCRSYTYTRDILYQDSQAVHSSIQDNGKGLLASANFTVAKETYRIVAPESLLIITCVRVINITDFRKSLYLFLQNVDTLKQYVQRVSAKLYLVCVMDLVATSVRETLRNTTDSQLIGVTIFIDIDAYRFNKFFHVAKAMNEFSGFDRVLLIDSDMDLVGFPIPEYFQLVARYVVAGTVHQNAREMLSRNSGKPTRQWFKVFNGNWWQENLPHVISLDTDFVEQAFVLMDAEFAGWFFPKILTTRHLYYRTNDGKLVARQSDFGPDLLWCGAAADWLAEHYQSFGQKPCGISTLSISHTDTRQLGLQAIDLSDNKIAAKIERRPLELYKKHFPSWYAYSRFFVSCIGGKVNLSVQCRAYVLRAAQVLHVASD